MASCGGHNGSGGHHELTANEKQDLTKTTTLHRREFAPAMTKRLRFLKGLVRKTVGYEFDALRLSGRSSATAARPQRQFTFTSNAEAKDEFLSWLNQAINDEVLEVIERTRIRDGEHYTARYVRSAYQRGIEGANQRLKDAGIEIGDVSLDATLRRPIHLKTLETIYTRTYDNLENITEDMQTGIRRQLTEGLEAGWNPRKMASKLTNEVDDIGITRAETLSRTEVSNAYNTASARRYQQSGVDQVQILVSDPCPICQALKANDPYPADEAAGLLPAHPNCVCSIAPSL